MEENFKIIYEILKKLESSMDIVEFDNSVLSYKALEISKPKWCRIMKMLFDSGYITEVNVWLSYDCSYPQVELIRPEITLKGLEYIYKKILLLCGEDYIKQQRELKKLHRVYKLHFETDTNVGGRVFFYTR